MEIKQNLGVYRRASFALTQKLEGLKTHSSYPKCNIQSRDFGIGEKISISYFFASAFSCGEKGFRLNGKVARPTFRTRAGFKHWLVPFPTHFAHSGSSSISEFVSAFCLFIKCIWLFSNREFYHRTMMVNKNYGKHGTCSISLFAKPGNRTQFEIRFRFSQKALSITLVAC